MTRLAICAGCLVGVWLLGACKKGDQPHGGQAGGKIIISTLSVVDKSPSPGSVAKVAMVQRWAIAALNKGGSIRVMSPGKKGSSQGYRLKLSYGFGRSPGRTDPDPTEADGTPKQAAFVVARAWMPRTDRITMGTSLVAPLEGEKSTPQGLLRRSVDHAMGIMSRQARLIVAPAAEVIAALKGSDPAALADAVRICGERKLKGALPGLIPLLNHPKRAVADRSIGALIAIGDRKAVKPLTRLAKLRDSERLAQVIDGVAALGGAEASSFLEFLAGGHAHPAIRLMAKEALTRMRMRRDQR